MQEFNKAAYKHNILADFRKAGYTKTSPLESHTMQVKDSDRQLGLFCVEATGRRLVGYRKNLEQAEWHRGIPAFLFPQYTFYFLFAGCGPSSPRAVSAYCLSSSLH